MSRAIENVFLEGAAQRLDDFGMATYRGDGSAYATGETAIVLGPLPAAPHRVVGITLYMAVHHQTQNLTTYRVQFRLRGKPNDTLDPGDLAGELFPIMHGIEAVEIGGLYVVSSRHVSTSPQGIDGNRRAERTENYEFITNPPVTPQRPD